MSTEHAGMDHAIQQLIDLIGTHPQLAFWVVFAVATGEALLVVGLFARSEDFFIAHGAKSVFLGRFVPGIKAMVPGIAGMSGMNQLRFTVVSIVFEVDWRSCGALRRVETVGEGSYCDCSRTRMERYFPSAWRHWHYWLPAASCCCYST